MKLKHGKFTLAVGFPEICAAALMVGAGRGTTLAVAALSALAHEGGHLLAARLCGAAVRSAVFSPVGGEIRTAGRMLSYHKDIIIALAGPAVSAAAAGVFFLFYRLRPGDVPLQAAATNAVFAAVNLLPVRPLDGWRILRGILYRREVPDAEKRLRGAGVFTVILIVLLFAAVSAERGFHPSLLIFAAYTAFHVCGDPRSPA